MKDLFSISGPLTPESVMALEKAIRLEAIQPLRPRHGAPSHPSVLQKIASKAAGV